MARQHDGSPAALATVDPIEVRRRAIWHDVRSVLAAATTNVEFVSASVLTDEQREVLVEIDHEIRLAADVIEIVSANRDEHRAIVLDLRALLWVARRSGAPIVVDATTAPFPVRGPYGALSALVEALASIAIPERPGAFVTARSTCRLSPVSDDSDAFARVRSTASALALDATLERGDEPTVVLIRR